MIRIVEWFSAWTRNAGEGAADDADAGASLKKCCTVAAIGAFVLVVGVAVWHVWFNHYLKAWSDPLNWLRFARHFGQEFATSRFPSGYPIFLRVVLDVVGPYWVFLSNVPVLLGACFLGGCLVRRALTIGPEDKVFGAAVVVAGFALILGVDPGMLVLMANPYRDPLSYVYLFASMILLVGYLEDRVHRLWRLAFSGLLIGAAYSVREPSVLMMAPMGLCGLCYWVKDRTIVLWKSVLVFFLFAVLGAAPLIGQSILKSGSVMPPQVTVEKARTAEGICGVYLGRMDVLAVNFQKMLVDCGKPVKWMLIPLVIGVGFALWERNRVMLAMVMPGALIYAVFYLFYYTFVHRYFYIVILFMAMISSYGLFRTAFGLARWAGERLSRRIRPAWMAAAGVLLVLAFSSAYACRELVPRGTRPDAFRFGMARALGATIAQYFPAEQKPVVLCRRNLCELIEWFCNVESYDVPFFNEVPGAARGDALRSHVDALRADGRRVYIFDFLHEGTDGRDTAPIAELFDLEKVADVSFKGCVPPTWGLGDLPLYEVKPWTNRVVSAVLTRPAGGGWIEIRAGRLWSAGSNRTYATLVVDGVVVTNRLPDGFSVFPIPATGAGEGLAVRVESDAPMRAGMSIRAKSFADELVYDLYYYAEPFSDVLRGVDAIDAAPGAMSFPSVVGRAALHLYAPVAPPGMVRVMETVLDSDYHGPWPPDGVDFYHDGRLLGSCKVERTKEEREIEFAVGPEAGTWPDIQLRRRPWRASPGSPEADSPPGGSTLVRRVRVGYVNEIGTSIAFRSGMVGDLYLIRDGFWHAELFDGSRPGRWTKGHAKLWLPMAQPKGDAVITLALSTRLRPPEAANVDLHVLCNGHPIALTTQSADDKTGVRIEQGMIPMAWLTTSNEVEIACAPWRPRDYGSSDTRELGIVVHRVAIEAKPSGADAL